jgi:hypothetical protein
VRESQELVPMESCQRRVALTRIQVAGWQDKHRANYHRSSRFPLLLLVVTVVAGLMTCFTIRLLYWLSEAQTNVDLYSYPPLPAQSFVNKRTSVEHRGSATQLAYSPRPAQYLVNFFSPVTEGLGSVLSVINVGLQLARRYNLTFVPVR